MPAVSVIIPVYNVSSFIEKCSESLMRQSMEDAEFIFVDDASPDNSISILEAVVKRYPNRDVKILHHSDNRGLPSARNTGLLHAKGDFIFHCDGDDWAEPCLLERLYDSAIRTTSDIVYCDFYLSFEKGERYMGNPQYDSIDEYLCNGLLAGSTKYNVWNKLVKRSLYENNGISFPDGHPMGEDMTMIRLASCATKVYYVSDALYHYVRINTNAYTQTKSEKQLQDILFNVNLTESFIKCRKAGMDEMWIEFFKLNTKLPFLLSDQKEDYSIWRTMFPEANRYIMSNKYQPLRIRLLQLFASCRMWPIVRVYYFLIQSLYRLMYR